MNQALFEHVTTASEKWLEVVAKLSSHRQEVARLGREFPNSRNLIETNPALALCVSCGNTLDTLFEAGPAVIENLLRMKRRDLAFGLGFNESESTVRILAKSSLRPARQES
jgi:hypothetical protein